MNPFKNKVQLTKALFIFKSRNCSIVMEAYQSYQSWVLVWNEPGLC